MGMPAARTHVVVNGVDCRRFHPGVDGAAIRREYGIAPDAPLVLQLARLIQQKRQEDVVRAFALARREVPDLRGLLVGWEDPRYSGPFPGYRAELEHLCAEAGLGDSLIIADARPDAPELLAAADMVAMPALGDAWNLAVTEAMAAGKPVIGAESGGIPEQIIHGTTGFLVPPRDPAALAAHIVTLARDPQLRARMGVAARKRAESFDETHVAAGFAPIYEALVGGPDGLPDALSVQPQA
jgi:glycosyltransferase involved in cell wall biosynthesis